MQRPGAGPGHLRCTWQPGQAELRLLQALALVPTPLPDLSPGVYQDIATSRFSSHHSSHGMFNQAVHLYHAALNNFEERRGSLGVLHIEYIPKTKKPRASPALTQQWWSSHNKFLAQIRAAAEMAVPSGEALSASTSGKSQSCSTRQGRGELANTVRPQETNQEHVKLRLSRFRFVSSRSRHFRLEIVWAWTTC